MALSKCQMKFYLASKYIYNDRIPGEVTVFNILPELRVLGKLGLR